MTIQRRFLPRAKALRPEVRSTRPGMIEGYAAVFYDGTPPSEYQLYDDTVERIAPGAFDRAIREDDVRVLFNHDANLLLGRTKAGTCRLFVDRKGLRYEADTPDTQVGRDVAECLQRGEIDGSSFSFEITDQAWRQEGGLYIREIKAVQLFDVGPVVFPAYQATTAKVRAKPGARAPARAALSVAGREAIRRRLRVVEIDDQILV